MDAESEDDSGKITWTVTKTSCSTCSPYTFVDQNGCHRGTFSLVLPLPLSISAKSLQETYTIKITLDHLSSDSPVQHTLDAVLTGTPTPTPTTPTPTPTTPTPTTPKPETITRTATSCTYSDLWRSPSYTNGTSHREAGSGKSYTTYQTSNTTYESPTPTTWCSYTSRTTENIYTNQKTKSRKLQLSVRSYVYCPLGYDPIILSCDKVSREVIVTNRNTPFSFSVTALGCTKTCTLGKEEEE